MGVKGRYVAQIIIDIDLDTSMMDDVLPFPEMHKRVTDGITPEVKRAIEDRIGNVDDGCTVGVIQQYADLYEVMEELEGREE